MVQAFKKISLNRVQIF